jgi:hypothetical protein
VVTERFSARNPITQAKILDLPEQHYSIVISAHAIDLLKRVTSASMEGELVDCHIVTQS